MNEREFIRKLEILARDSADEEVISRWSDIRQEQFGARLYEKSPEIGGIEFFKIFEEFRASIEGQESNLDSIKADPVDPLPITDPRSISLFLEETLLKPLLTSLRPEVREKVKSVPLGVLSTRVVNAHTLQAPNGRPVVILDRGLLTILRLFLEARISCQIISIEENRLYAEQYLREVLEFILDYYRNQGALAIPEKFVVKMSRDAFEKCMLSCTAIETFVIAHELAHVYAGHLDSGSDKSVVLGGEGKGGYSVEFYDLSQSQELEADAMAWEWYRRFIAVDPVYKLVNETWSIENTPLYFFLILHFVEHNLGVRDSYTTHPSAIKRIENIIGLLEDSQREEEEAQYFLEFSQSLENEYGQGISMSDHESVLSQKTKVKQPVSKQVGYKDYLLPTQKQLEGPLDEQLVIKVVSLTHAYIDTRLLGISPVSIENDVHFYKSALRNTTNLRNEEMYDKEEITRKSTIRLKYLSDWRRHLVWSALILDFAEKNHQIWKAFTSNDWIDFARSSSECSAYTFEDFPEPYICIYHCLLRVLMPPNYGGMSIEAAWNTLGYCSRIVDYHDGMQIAIRALDEMGKLNIASSWLAPFR